MAIPQSKLELQQAIQLNFGRLMVELKDLPLSEVEKPELEGHAKGTQMSLHNLLAYLVGWGQLVLKWNARKAAGLPVDFPETGFRWNELGQLAQHFYKCYAHLPFEELSSLLEKTTWEILALVESKSNAELYETPWYEKWTLGRMIQLNTAAPFKNARDRIRKWKKDHF
jgi:hypothetical protein